MHTLHPHYCKMRTPLKYHLATSNCKSEKLKSLCCYLVSLITIISVIIRVINNNTKIYYAEKLVLRFAFVHRSTAAVPVKQKMSEASEKMHSETGARVLHHKHFREDYKISRENPHLLRASRVCALGEFYGKNQLFFSLLRHRVVYESRLSSRKSSRLGSNNYISNLLNQMPISWMEIRENTNEKRRANCASVSKEPRRTLKCAVSCVFYDHGCSYSTSA